MPIVMQKVTLINEIQNLYLIKATGTCIEYLDFEYKEDSA